MKSILKISNMSTSSDVNRIHSAISQNDGVMACEISQNKGEIIVIYNNSYLNMDNIIESIEQLGYVII